MNEDKQRQYLQLYLGSSNRSRDGHAGGRYSWCSFGNGLSRHVLRMPYGTAKENTEPLHYTGPNVSEGTVISESWGAVEEFDRLLSCPILPNHPELRPR